MHRVLVSDDAMVAYAACAVAAVAVLPALRRREWGVAVHVAAVVLLVGGILTVLSATLLGTTSPTGRVNLVPGASIVELFSADYRNAVENVVGNVLLFLPLGFLAVLVTRRGAVPVTLGAAALSVAIELTQLALGGRWVDVDDVILNTTGAFLGALTALATERLELFRRHLTARRRARTGR